MLVHPETFPEVFNLSEDEPLDWYSACVVSAFIGDEEDKGEYDLKDPFYMWLDGHADDAATAEGETFSVNMVRDGPGELEWVVIDSGADISLLPQRYSMAGTEGGKRKMKLEDAQGSEVQQFGTRHATLELHNDQHESVLVRDEFLVANVRSVLLSLGRLARRGWRIVPNS